MLSSMFLKVFFYYNFIFTFCLFLYIIYYLTFVFLSLTFIRKRAYIVKKIKIKRNVC